MSKYIFFNSTPKLNLFNKISVHSVQYNTNCNNCMLLEQVNTIKYSGITSKLKWDTLYIQQILFLFDIHIKRLLFLSLTQSIVNYGIWIQGQAYDSHTYWLNITLNRLITFLLLKSMYYSNDSAYLELNVSCIQNLYFRNILLRSYRFRSILAKVNHV